MLFLLIFFLPKAFWVFQRQKRTNFYVCDGFSVDSRLQKNGGSTRAWYYIKFILRRFFFWWFQVVFPHKGQKMCWTLRNTASSWFRWKGKWRDWRPTLQESPAAPGGGRWWPQCCLWGETKQNPAQTMSDGNCSGVLNAGTPQIY